MAYVNFWKGLAANYSAETHAEGIYQCTDTGDTYIFGTLNSGSAGGSSEIKVIGNINIGVNYPTDSKSLTGTFSFLIPWEDISSNPLDVYGIRIQGPNGTPTMSTLVPLKQINTAGDTGLSGFYGEFNHPKSLEDGSDTLLRIFITSSGGYTITKLVPESPVVVIKSEDPLYFEPESDLETLQALTFPNVNAEYVDSLYLSNKVVIMDNENAQGTFGDGIHRYTVFSHVIVDSNSDGNIKFQWIYNNMLRTLSIVPGNPNEVTVTETDLTPQTVDLSGYKKIEEVSALPSSPDANTLYVIPEDEGGSGEGTFG